MAQTDSEEEDIERLDSIANIELLIETRSDRLFRARLNWQQHVRLLVAEKNFERYYRMSLESFEKLVDLVRPTITFDEDMSIRSSGGTAAYISAEIVMHCLIRYLAGGSYLDIRLVGTISIPSFYRCLHIGVRAISQCQALTIRFETDDTSLKNRQNLFRDLSSHEVIRGCVGCIDGILIQTKAPSLSDVPNPRDYFSGHYGMYGLNVQAVCDHAYRFIWMGVNTPGGMSDHTNYQLCSISSLVESLPTTKYVLGDNAYQVTEHLLTPFSGSQNEDVWNDFFNLLESTANQGRANIWNIQLSLGAFPATTEDEV